MPAKSPQNKKKSIKGHQHHSLLVKDAKLRVQEAILNKLTREYCYESQLRNTVLFKVYINLK